VLAVSLADRETQKRRPIIVMGGMPTALAVFLERPQAEDQIGANGMKVAHATRSGKREMV
jgi:hypothetical protein